MTTIERTAPVDETFDLEHEHRAAEPRQRGLALATGLAMVPTMASPLLTLVDVDPFASVMIGMGATLTTLIVGAVGFTRWFQRRDEREHPAA